jgi:VIT1/CCC1 family predicted Fe2+/Mn2+ transporter
MVTFLSKLVVAASFALPFFFLALQPATYLALGWGAFLLVALSWQLARLQSEAPLPIIAEHLLVGTLVVVLSHGVGLWVAHAF